MRKAEMASRKILVKDLNDVLVCTLCNGYLIDATTLVECHHVFCRGCILRYFENCKAACPSCNTVYKRKNQVFFKADPQIQSIVYKVVPGLYSKEMQRREDFYRSTGVRASSSCSDDSVLERERDLINDEEALITSYVGDKTQFFGPEDSISLSLEYYQRHLDTTPVDGTTTKTKQVDSDRGDAVTDKKSEISVNNNNSDVVSDKNKTKSANSSKENGAEQDGGGGKGGCGNKRYLQCPAAVSMRHLQKFVRMKFALTAEHRVDIIYEGEVLPSHFSLMDVAYTFKWKRLKPMRFFYCIFIPSKIQPIKIVLSTAGKQLQVVKSGEPPPPPPPPPPPLPPPPPEIKEERKEESEEKERLLAHLQLQSKTKVQNSQQQESVPDNNKGPHQPPDCVFDYEEQDKEEIKRFAEIRDREWALQKKLDESRERDEEYHHFSKKRKKNKHSKNDFAYKKRKLHAEITNKEEELKLKVKLTQHNGHKHKHHKSSSTAEMSSKEKLLQMRQIRHKHVVSEDKNIQTTMAVGGVSRETSTELVKEDKDNKPKETKEEAKPSSNGIKAGGDEQKKVAEVATTTKTLRSDFPSKTSLNKEWGNRVPTVQIERHEQTEQQVKKTVFNKIYPVQQKPMEKPPSIKIEPSAKPPPKPPLPLNRPTSSQLERKLANLQQRCTIEAKNPAPPKQDKPPLEKKVEKTKPPPHQYPAGFTVSKIESGAVKRKVDSEEGLQEKRPSLEITLINPPPPTTTAGEVKAAPVAAKRPPPPTIPLDRIKKSFNFNKSGISIIPKVPDKCDNIGALDLSSKPPSKEGESSKQVNGFGSAPSSKEGKSVNMSNLQMLSKVATEHSTLNKTSKPRPQMPNLQTLKIPSPGQNNLRMPPNLPKLTEISKSQFRLLNPQIRNLRPNQNQSIRNIPNPSLLVRQQNQNRLNSLNPVRENNNGDKEGSKAAAATTPTTTEAPKPAEAKPSENNKEVKV